MRSILILTLFIASGSLFSQIEKQGLVKFYIDVDNGYFEVLLNDTLALKKFRDSLPEGHYQAQIWSPTYEQFSTEFDINAGEVTEVNAKLIKSEDYAKFEFDYQEYQWQFRQRVTLPVTLSLLSTLTTGYLMMKSYDTKKLVENDILLYHHSSDPGAIQDVKASIDQNNRKYDRLRTGYYIFGGLSVALIGTSIWSGIYFKNHFTEPVFNEDSPFRDKFSLNPTPYGCRIVYKLG